MEFLVHLALLDPQDIKESQAYLLPDSGTWTLVTSPVWLPK